MLHFCTVDDIAASTNFGGRYNSVLEGKVESVTEKFNSFLNRRMDYVVNHVETFNIPRLRWGEKRRIWLERRNVQGTVALALSTIRDFEDPLIELMSEARYELDAERGTITLYGYIPRALDGLRVTYTGGYPPRNDDPLAMACPAALRNAAIEQVVYEADRLINSMGATNTAEDKEGAKYKTTQHGLLITVQSDIQHYRRPLGG